MYKGDHGCCTETDIREPERDVDQHQDRRYDYGYDGISLHLAGDGAADILRIDLVIRQIELGFQRFAYRRTRIFIQL